MPCPGARGVLFLSATSMQAEAFKVKLVLKGAPSNAASGLGYRWLKSSPHWSGQAKALPMNTSEAAMPQPLKR